MDTPLLFVAFISFFALSESVSKFGRESKRFNRKNSTNNQHPHFMKGKPMSRFVFVCVLALFAISIGLAQDINGKWKAQMEGPNGAMEFTYTFKAAGDSLTGTIASPMGELPFSNGKINGKTFSFDVSFNDMTFTNQGTVLGDSLSLKMPGPGGDSMELILKRASE
jgi:hypothetical protein